MSVLTCELSLYLHGSFPQKKLVGRLVGLGGSSSSSFLGLPQCTYDLIISYKIKHYLSSQSVHSLTGTVINFLSAIALVNDGVREILPFVRYIAQFIDFEFNAIKGQNKGDGVVCAATW